MKLRKDVGSTQCFILRMSISYSFHLQIDHYIEELERLEPVGVNNIIVLIIIVCAAAALIVILIASNRSMQQKTSQKPTRQEINDPVTQPIRISNEKSLVNPSASATSASNPEPSIAYARLIRLSEQKMTTQPNAFIILKNPDSTIGSDKKKSTICLEDPSISPVHAHFRLSPEGGVILSDEGSKYGTLVNFAPLSRQGIHLEDRDIVHIGKLVFRFELLKQG
jgi:pSer/pThr/pTyr-binding forkhead associated (FHA) protein